MFKLRSLTKLISCRTFCYGQPVAATHPNLLKPEEVIPGFNKNEFASRRQNLIISIVSKMTSSLANHFKTDKSDFCVLIPSASTKYSSHAVPYKFQQNSDFLYFTGFLEPDSFLFLSAKNVHNSSIEDILENHECHLFVQENSSHSLIWSGGFSGSSNASEVTGIDQCWPLNKFKSIFNIFASDRSSKFVVYFNPQDEIISDKSQHRKLIQEAFEYENVKEEVMDPEQIFHELRVFKSEAEHAALRKSSSIMTNSIVQTMMHFSKPGISETSIDTSLIYNALSSGATHMSFPPVVAGGERACTLHYLRNDQLIKNDEMVLVDCGCSYWGYASDITRTWPINGTFTDAQHEVYDIVLKVQKTCLSLCRPGISLNEIHKQMILQFANKLLPKLCTNFSKLSSSERIFIAEGFCPHHVGHYLGLDVHDCFTVSRDVQLEAGMVITIEPGLYFPRDRSRSPHFASLDSSIFTAYAGIGVRIEDDVLITEMGHEILSKDCPKDPSDFRDLIQSPKHGGPMTLKL